MRKIAKTKNARGFSLSELMLAIAIIAPLCAMTIVVFLNCMRINELSKHTALAMSAAMGHMNDIERTAYVDIYNTFNNQTFPTEQLNGIGKTYVDNTNADYLTVTNVVCWKENNGRIIGEDENLNGQLEANEKTIDTDNQIDSPVQIVSIIAAP
jgi:prepilin-type N-terminal cleavage/methylation domain-containing protein